MAGRGVPASAHPLGGLDKDIMMPPEFDTPTAVSAFETTLTCPPAMVGLIGLLAKATARQLAEAATPANTDRTPAGKVRR